MVKMTKNGKNYKIALDKLRPIFAWGLDITDKSV